MSQAAEARLRLRPRWLRHALWWLQRHSLYERWANVVWYSLHRRRPTQAEIELAAQDLCSQFREEYAKYGHGEEYAEYGFDEPMDEWFSRSADLFRDVKDRDRVVVYSRAAELARERRSHRLPQPRRASAQVTLPSTRSRESRPRRRATASALDDDPSPSSDSRALGRSRGRRDVGAA